MVFKYNLVLNMRRQYCKIPRWQYEAYLEMLPFKPHVSSLNVKLLAYFPANVRLFALIVNGN